MKTFLFQTLLVIFSISLNAQNGIKECEVKIKVLEGKYMNATATPNPGLEKKVSIKFAEDFVSVMMPYKDQSLTLRIINSNCQAYCSRDKRVRQLNANDRKLLINLINKERTEIEKQVGECKS